MKSVTSANRLLHCTAGASAVELALVAPIFLLLVLGVIDLGILMWQWNSAAKATHWGARTAVVSTPVASGIINPSWDHLLIGEPCLDAATGLPLKTGTGTDYCPALDTVCTADSAPSTSGTCSSGYAFDNAAFEAVYARMRAIYPQLGRQNVQIAYKTTGLGFVGRPGGLPMTVTISVRCMTYDLIVLDSLLGWLVPANPCGGSPPGWPIPESRTVLTSESLGTS